MISDRRENRPEPLDLTFAAIRKARSPSVSEPGQPDLRLIAHRAFQLYEARGREDGHDVEDWLQAEEEIRRDGILPKASVASAVYEDSWRV
jgi:hypothetical protein